MRKAVLIGMLIGGLGGPLFLTAIVWWFFTANRTEYGLFAALFGFLFLAGPGSAVAGGFMGERSLRWQQRGISTGHLVLLAGFLGVALWTAASFVSLGFFSSFRAIAHKLSILEWVWSFLPTFLGSASYVSLIGLCCGICIAFVMKRMT